MLCPSIYILLEVGSIRRFTIRRVVVLPQPDGPMSIQNSPSAISKERLLTALVPSGHIFDNDSIFIN